MESVRDGKLFAKSPESVESSIPWAKRCVSFCEDLRDLADRSLILTMLCYSYLYQVGEVLSIALLCWIQMGYWSCRVDCQIVSVTVYIGSNENKIGIPDVECSKKLLFSEVYGEDDTISLSVR